MIKKVLIFLIRVYRVFSGFTNRRCRFYPTCSEYMLEAINSRGPARGVVLGLGRIIRCHPFNSGGHDPVPSFRPGKRKDKE